MLLPEWLPMWNFKHVDEMRLVAYTAQLHVVGLFTSGSKLSFSCNALMTGILEEHTCRVDMSDCLFVLYSSDSALLGERSLESLRLSWSI